MYSGDSESIKIALFDPESDGKWTRNEVTSQKLPYLTPFPGIFRTRLLASCFRSLGIVSCSSLGRVVFSVKITLVDFSIKIDVQVFRAEMVIN